MSATETIAKFIVETGYQQIPAAAILLSKRSILDCVGLCLAGGDMPVGKIVVEYVREIGGAPEAVVIGKKLKAPAPHAALANGTMITSLNWADTSFIGNVWHPTPTILSAILSLADRYQISGKDVIKAHIIGFEVGSRIALSWIQHYDLGWLTTATVGTLASAAAAAKILELDVQQTRMALGIAADTTAGTKQNMGAMHAFSAGKAARDGVVAASLAKKGCTADANILEGPISISQLMTCGKYDPVKLSEGLGSRYHMTLPGGLSLKFYPCGHLTHWCIDGILNLVQEHDLKADSVAEVICEMPTPFIQTLRFTTPKTALEAKISTEYCMAAALLDHEVSSKVFTDDKVMRPEAQELMSRVKCRPNEGNPASFPAGEEPTTVTVKLKDGRTFKKSINFPKGDIRHPLTEEELSGKFTECAGGVFKPQKISQVLDLLWNLDSLSEVSRLTALLMG